MPSERNDARLRWGIVGYGDVVIRRVAPAIMSCRTAHLVAIAGRNLATARIVAERFGAELGTDDIDRLLDCVDAVYVATPVATHLRFATCAIERRLPVMIEKPLCAGLGDLGAFAHAIAHTDVPVGVAYYRRVGPAFRWLAHKVAQCAFGRFVRADVVHSFPFNPPVHDPKAWRLQRELAGGGVLADAGSHRLDLLCALFGLPSTVASRMEDFTAGNCERRALVELRWRDGAQARLDLSWDNHSCDRFGLTFQDAEIVLDPLDAGRIECRRGGEISIIACDGPRNAHAPLIEDFQLALRHGGSPACGTAAGLTVDGLIVAAREASDTGRVVALPEVEETDSIVRFIEQRQAFAVRRATCAP